MLNFLSSVPYNAEYPRRLRAAVIGCGGHALRNIFPTFQYAPLDLAAVCDLVPERAASAARLFGAASSYSDVQTMLETEHPEVIFVILNCDAEGQSQYPALAIQAMQAGASVWIEKPPATRSDEIRQMMQVSRDTGKFVSVGFKKMFYPANVKAKEITLTPEFGPVSAITARYPQDLPPQDERGDDKRMAGFLDHIVHPYSLLRYFGGPIESLQFEREHRTGASLTTMRFTNGALGSLLLSAGQSQQSPLERTEIIGQDSNVIVDNNIRVTYHRPKAQRGSYGRAGSAYGDDEAATLFWEPEFSLGQLYNKGLFLLGYAPEILYFCDCALNDRVPEIASLDDALELMRIYEAYRQPDGQKINLLKETA